jgi:hypothetical protein
MVLKHLNDDQKGRRNEASAEMLEWLETETNFLYRVITGDENWFFEYVPEIMSQREEWHTPQSPSQKKARKNHENGSLIYSREVVHKQLVPAGCKVNQKYYLEVLDRLRKSVMRVRTEITDDGIFRTSSRQRTHIQTQKCQFVNFWRQSAFPCFPQTPYSPDLSPRDITFSQN